jgi:hypothetical protein
MLKRRGSVRSMMLSDSCLHDRASARSASTTTAPSVKSEGQVGPPLA